jgi:hypothetical protein
MSKPNKLSENLTQFIIQEYGYTYNLRNVI